MRDLRRFPVLVLALAVSLLALGGCSVHASRSGPDPERAVAAPAAGPRSGTVTRAHPRPGFDTHAHSTTDPSSIWVVVNKTHPIDPQTFRPDLTIVRGYQVAAAAAPSLTDLMEASDRAGLGFKIESAFRSYDYQVRVHAEHVASQGQQAADKVSARAGNSEHQTGLAVDLITPGDPSCDMEQCFAWTPGGRWLSENAWKYGFIVRYTVGNESITGYEPEPWHLRYVGRSLATAMHQAKVTTLEQFLDVPGGDYPN